MSNQFICILKRYIRKICVFSIVLMILISDLTQLKLDFIKPEKISLHKNIPVKKLQVASTLLSTAGLNFKVDNEETNLDNNLLFNINEMILPSASTSTITAICYPTTLNELSLDGSLVVLTMFGNIFKDSISTSDFAINNAPRGLSISKVWLNYNGDAFLQIAFDGTALNSTITNLTVTALPSSNSRSESITCNCLTISPAIPLEGFISYYATG